LQFRALYATTRGCGVTAMLRPLLIITATHLVAIVLLAACMKRSDAPASPADPPPAPIGGAAQ